MTLSLTLWPTGLDFNLIERQSDDLFENHRNR
jgi:hypothetical protein